MERQYVPLKSPGFDGIHGPIQIVQRQTFRGLDSGYQASCFSYLSKLDPFNKIQFATAMDLLTLPPTLPKQCNGP